ncbi:MAG: hypothetical protein RLN90_09695 [Balneolaceae bacterium]
MEIRILNRLRKEGLIEIVNNNLELHKCGVKVGMQFKAHNPKSSNGMYFTAPDGTECVIYEGDFKGIYDCVNFEKCRNKTDDHFRISGNPICTDCKEILDAKSKKAS